MMFSPYTKFSLFVALSSFSGQPLAAPSTVNGTVDVNWYAPNATQINNLNSVLSTSGVYGFIFNSSQTPNSEYGTYNWCNMPHVRCQEYPKASDEYELQYVEVVSFCFISQTDVSKAKRAKDESDSQASQTHSVRVEHLSGRIISVGL
jgi:acid phosphatase